MIKKFLKIAVISMLLTSFSDAKVIFSGGAEDENPEQLPQKEIVDLIFNDTSINKEDLQLRKEQILECLKDANMKKTDTEKLLSAVKIPLGNNPNSHYYFVRGSQKNYCLAFYGAHTFQYWFVEINDSKAKILLNNWSDGVDVLSSVSNGMKDIETMGFY